MRPGELSLVHGQLAGMRPPPRLRNARERAQTGNAGAYDDRIKIHARLSARLAGNRLWRSQVLLPRCYVVCPMDKRRNLIMLMHIYH
jgi:hypothetical protein